MVIKVARQTMAENSQKAEKGGQVENGRNKDRKQFSRINGHLPTIYNVDHFVFLIIHHFHHIHTSNVPEGSGIDLACDGSDLVYVVTRHYHGVEYLVVSSISDRRTWKGEVVFILIGTGQSWK